MARVAREIPELAGKLSAPRVTYVRSLRKTYITFESTVLAEEKQFLQMEKLLKELFPGRPLAVRIISPGLRTDFLEDPMEYRQVLDDFLRRNYPAARGWIGQIDWQIEKNQLRGDETFGEDEEAILDEIHGRWPGMPVILFGHSMGTIIARAFLQKHSGEFHKVALSGYPNPNGAAGAGILLTDVIASVKGGKGYSKLVDGMVLGPFAKAVPKAVTPQDWLSVNRENVQRYIADPLCGVRFTLGSYNALFHLIRMMDSPEQYEKVRKDLPILLISGKEDPCTGGEKGRADSENRLRRAGFRNLEIITLDGMRHEILNETGRENVFRRILEFMDKE